MKNKIYYILTFLILSFSFISNVFAEDLTYSVSTEVVGGNTTVATGSEATINVALTSESDIKTCTFELINDQTIEYISKSGANSYIVGTETNGKFPVSKSSDETTFTSGQNILELKYKINGAGKLTIKTECTATNDAKGTAEAKVIEFNVTSEDEDISLKSLTATGGTLSPSFNSSTTQYILNLDNKEFSLTMTANNSSYQDKIEVKDSNGTKLDPNKITFSDASGQAMMELSIYVNEKKAYEILAKYQQQGLNNSLTSLKIAGKEVKLQENKYNYSITVSKDTTSVRIEAKLADEENFKFAENNGSTNFQTPNATNVYPIIIEPKNSSVGAESATYIITINKEGIVEENPQTPGNNDNPNNDSNVSTNPTTAGASMYIMGIILILSLTGSIILYRKNLAGYNE